MTYRMVQTMVPFAEFADTSGLLFPSLGRMTPSGDQITAIVGHIRKSRDDSQEGSIPAGYTYLGQFVAHDFVPGRSNTRKVLPRLNLDSVYGLGDESVMCSGGRFLLGPRDEDGQVVDLFRWRGEALIPEARNDENVIIAQIHLMFQKIHNELVDRLERVMGPGPMVMEAARKLNVYLYQRLLIDDYLPRILAPSVSDFLLSKGERVLSAEGFLSDPLEFVPLEFSHAAFRFGHSMVRQSYTLLNGKSFTLDELVRRGKPIPACMALDWDSMFGFAGANPANAIDTELASALSAIATDEGPVDLVLMNVLGSKALPSGGSIGDLFRGKFWELEIMRVVGQDIEEALGIANFPVENLPLWVYFLIEAMCHQRDSRRSDHIRNLRYSLGRCLGPLASLIVGEIVLAGMRNAPFGAHTPPDVIANTLPDAATAELHKLLIKLGTVTVQRLVREFPSAIIQSGGMR